MQFARFFALQELLQGNCTPNILNFFIYFLIIFRRRLQCAEKLGWFGGVGDAIHHTRGAKDEVIYYDIHLEVSVVKQATFENF